MLHPVQAPAVVEQLSGRAWLWRLALVSTWWIVDGAATASTYLGMAGVDRSRVIGFSVASAALWIPQSMLALWLAERWPIERGRWRTPVLIHVAASLGVVLLKAFIVQAANPVLRWYDGAVPPWPELLLTSFANNFFLFWLLVGAGHALFYARQSQVRTEQLARAELQQLKSQLHPHFLFNTLNAISTFVRTDPEVATQTIARLSTLLRHALQRAATQEVTLDEELSLLQAYLGIEQLRFDDRLHVEWNIAPETRRAIVPHLVLQPLVENAIRHGITPRSTTGTLAVVASRVRERLRLVVQDDGVGCDVSALHEHGVGLTNTRHRLQQLYGSSHEMRVTTSPGKGMQVEIELPFREGRAA